MPDRRAAAGVLMIATLGSILAGLATPTEAAAIGAFGAMLLVVVYRRLTWRASRTPLLHHGDVQHGAAAGRHLQHVRRGVRAAGHRQLVTDALLSLPLPPWSC